MCAVRYTGPTVEFGSRRRRSVPVERGPEGASNRAKDFDPTGSSGSSASDASAAADASPNMATNTNPLITSLEVLSTEP